MKTRITSSKNEKIKFLKSIKNDIKSNYFIIEGYHLVDEALKLNLVSEIYCTNEDSKYNEAILISESVLKVISSVKNPEGIIALCKKPKNKKYMNKIIFLDNVQDPGNLGTIIRVAKAFNFDTVYSNINFYNDKVIRSSQGAIFDINLVSYKDSINILKMLKNSGFSIYATSLDKDSIDIKKVDFKQEKIVILFGNEGSGISKEIYNLVDKKIIIPMQFESLNVAVASGIILYEIYNKNAGK